MRRCPTLPTLIAVVVALAAWAVPVRADDIETANYTLKVPGGLPDPGSDVDHVKTGVSLPQLEATVIPAGGIMPPTQSDGSQGSPLTILPDSFGFDKDKLVVALNNNPKVNPTDQKFGLVFFNGGLAADNLIHFSLSIDKALAGTPPTLNITDPATLAGMVVTADATVKTTSMAADSSTSTTSAAPVTASIPEPLSVLVWSTMAGCGLLRARRLRRCQPAAA